jgi:DNA repair protein RecN (Recombination protein N)
MWRKIQKKYGNTSTEVLEVFSKIEEEISNLENFDQHSEEMEQEISKLELWLNKQAEVLHKERMQSSLILVKKVNEELKDLNMKGVQFGVQIEKLHVLTPRGISDVEFTIQVSKEDKFRSLNKIASGGELSRILLSLKKVVGLSELPRTYLFDEVDTGVSGDTAERVGAKLKAISKGQQVVCVTHLPQVAVFADTHFVISKIQAGKKVGMEVHPLNSKQREEEIARLLSGTKVTATSREHARQMLKQI